MSQAETAVPMPLPELEGLAGEFYGYCRKGELRFQRCSDCGSWRHVPREMCADCGSWNWEWERSSGRGRVFTWTVVTRALHPAFQDACPYAPAVIEMDEGVRILSQVTDCSPDQLQIDMPVEVVFEDASEEVALPKFRRSTS
ncbi:MAG: Zn-ribbon domain-containing OB-fold protein [bacterium]|nr:Zn-ribbon domain-containing OB-fold protein [bacterium]